MKYTNTSARQSVIILIMELIALEVLINLIGYGMKFPFVNGWVASTAVYTGITLFIQALNIFFIIMIVLRWVSTEYRIENSSLIMRSGYFSTKEKMYTLDSIETVEVEQSLLGRIFNFGTVHIYSPLLTKHVYIWAIPDVHAFAEEVKSYIPKNTHVTVTAKR